ncbi:unnamed protein product [Urochloa decumbens]|uniref:Rx N-terminal domain-containing protein n=1 Tax=Urochloa decumbens TaxID=240449 RepID=A0ABC8ZPW4_9POAL
MGTVLDAITSKLLSKLGETIQDEVVMTCRVKKDIKRLKRNLEHFAAVREDAEALAMQDKGVASWWQNISDVMFDLDDVIDIFTAHSQKLSAPPRLICCDQSLFSCFINASFDHKVAKRIKDINGKLSEIKMNRDMFSLEIGNRQLFQVTNVDRRQTSPIDELEVVGRDIKQGADELVKMIISTCHENRLTLLGIQGMGGIERGLRACIVVTTRNLDVLAEMHATYTHQVNKMNDSDGLELLMKKSFRQYEQTNDFSDIGYQIVKKCDGLPLAIKVVSGVLATKRTRAEWENIRDSRWSVHGLPEELGGPLYLSYRHLPPQLKQCFLWCALLPPYFVIQRDAVAYWWVAEGFVRKEYKYPMHEIAEEYYHELIRRNLLQPRPEFVDKGESTMHDLLRSLGQYLTRDHSLSMNAENNEALPNLRRLVISSDIEEIPAIEEQKCMRSLLIFNNKNFKSVNKDIFRRLEHIRVLVLTGTSIHSIPESVGSLVLLRLLDLGFTNIGNLPESIGSLISLEYLSLCGCNKLNSLPASLMKLSNISFLQLERTAIEHVPRGIAKFQQLYNLRGVFESGIGFRLDELQFLPNIQRLLVLKLEKATPRGVLALKKSHNLRDLALCCTMGTGTHDRTHYQAYEIERIQQVYEMLIPSPSLLYIYLNGFPGVRFPEWLCLKPEHKLPNLTHMHLNECISCSQLPPAGQMPELLVLQIRGADSVVSIGAELLGKGVNNAVAFFPKLELLHVFDMRNLESWSLSTENLSKNLQTESQHLVLMPRLKRLFLLDCPKLRALPEDLSRIANLKRVHIEGAHNLEEVVNLPAVVWLKVKNNRSLRRVFNLFKLQDLFAQDCPGLDLAENLSSLKCVYMVDCPNAQHFIKCILKGEEEVQVYVATLGADGRDIFPDESIYN